MAAEERQSGTNPELTELDQALENIIERSEGAEEEIARGDANKQKQVEKEKETAEDVRKRSMERLAETKQREVEEGRRKKRRTGDGDKIDYLKEKSKEHIDLKREELELKRKELEIRERELELKAREQETRLRQET